MTFDIKLAKFTKDHEWIFAQGDTGLVGISQYAAMALGMLVHLEFSVKTGDKVRQGNPVAVVESAKSASDIYSPFTCTVTELNTELLKSPELVYKDATIWILKVQNFSPDELQSLMSHTEYLAYLETLG